MRNPSIRIGPTQTFVRLIGKSDQRATLKFPLSVGQKWTYEYATRPPGSKFNQRRSVEVNVVGIEQVTTPREVLKPTNLLGTRAGRLVVGLEVRAVAQ